MELIVKPRAEGKTLDAILRAEQEDAVLVVAHTQVKGVVKKIADSLNAKIKIETLYDYRKKLTQGIYNTNTKVVIDELQPVLDMLLPSKIIAATHSNPGKWIVTFGSYFLKVHGDNSFLLVDSIEKATSFGSYREAEMKTSKTGGFIQPFEKYKVEENISSRDRYKKLVEERGRNR